MDNFFHSYPKYHRAQGGVLCDTKENFDYNFIKRVLIEDGMIFKKFQLGNGQILWLFFIEICSINFFVRNFITSFKTMVLTIITTNFPFLHNTTSMRSSCSWIMNAYLLSLDNKQGVSTWKWIWIRTQNRLENEFQKSYPWN